MKKYLVPALLLTLIALIAGVALWLFETDIDAGDVDAKYSNSASQFMAMTDGARVHYRDQGNPAGPTVVLVHGSNASLHTWEPWIASLGKTFRIVTLDLPGHGLTGAVPAGNYGSAAQIATVAALVKHLELQRFVLGGNSMGGGVTWRYALEYPNQIEALLLVDASGLRQWRQEVEEDAEGEEKNGAANSSENEGPLVFRLLRKPWFRAIAAYLDTKALTGQGLRSAFHDPEKVTDSMIELYYQMSMREGTRRATLARFADFGKPNPAGEPTEADMATLTMPALVMWGETDTLIPAEYAERFVKALPNSQLVIYPEVGHLPMEEIPDRSAADVQKFLASSLRFQ